MDSSNMEDQKTEGYECEDCSYETKSRIEFVRHVRKHTGEKPYQCSVCAKSFSLKSNLVRHELNHSGEKRFECDICSAKFTEKCSLNRHMHFHTKNLLDCSLCDDKCTEKNHLKAHEDMLVCSICGRKFTRSVHLKSHMLIHTGEKPFQCTVCNKTFRTKTHLKKHSFIHAEEKPFQCSECKKQFTCKPDFERHMRRHKGEFYNCVHCSKKYLNKHLLNQHLTIHTDEPIRCLECKMIFSSRRALKRHVVQKHVLSGKSFICFYCGKLFSWKSGVIYHVKKQHACEMEDGVKASANDVEKPFQCSLCDLYFSTQRSCQWHEICVHKLVKRLDPIDMVNFKTNSEKKDKLGKYNLEMDCAENNEEDSRNIFPENEVFVKEEIAVDDISEDINTSEEKKFFDYEDVEIKKDLNGVGTNSEVKSEYTVASNIKDEICFVFEEFDDGCC